MSATITLQKESLFVHFTLSFLAGVLWVVAGALAGSVNYWPILLSGAAGIMYWDFEWILARRANKKTPFVLMTLVFATIGVVFLDLVMKKALGAEMLEMLGSLDRWFVNTSATWAFVGAAVFLLRFFASVAKDTLGPSIFEWLER